MTRAFVSLLQFALFLLPAASALAQTETDTEKVQPRQLNIGGKTWTGDFDQMLDRHMIRVAVPYSRSLYFIDKGRERGLMAEMVRDVERSIRSTQSSSVSARSRCTSSRRRATRC